MEEIWAPICGWEGLYEVSTLGRVRSLDRLVIEKTGKTRRRKGWVMAAVKSGKYFGVTLSKGGCEVRLYLHRLVAEAFIPNPESKACVNHIDFNRSNNAVANLEWVTYAENSAHAFANKNWESAAPKGSNCSSAKLTEALVYEIRSNYAPNKALELAEKYGLTRGAIYHIISGRTWTHVPFPPDYQYSIRPRKR